MDHLWAPWRKAYILQKSAKRCVFCQIKTSSQNAKKFVLKRSSHSFAVLNLFPYNNGHAMVVPSRHVSGLEKLRDEELLDLMQLLNQLAERMQKVLKCRGMNVGINLGKVAGAGIPGHVHIHAVPRWAGDSNFMPVLGHTKVISESLESVYQRLRWDRTSK